MKRIFKLNSVKEFKGLFLHTQQPQQPQHPLLTQQPSTNTASSDLSKLYTQLDDISAKLVELKTGGIN